MASLKNFYFSDFEKRRPEPPLPFCPTTEFVWQLLATATVFLGCWYLGWRWMYSLNWEALWFSLPVVIAESCAFVGLLLFFHNLWSVNDVASSPAPKRRTDVFAGGGNALISVDVFLPTYNEDPELTRYSIRDAMALKYPHPIEIRVHVLDDGNRFQMERVANEEGANYITTATNVGYKAGNLRNGMEHTTGDFLVILDSDTRPFSTLLENTLGYFRDPEVAWVQTPQWFYDLPQGRSLRQTLSDRFGRAGRYTADIIEKIVGPVQVGQDPFISDSKLFYDVIQRRRNGANASFCCGAGSVHRRDAVMEAAMKSYANSISSQKMKYCGQIKNTALRQDVECTLNSEMLHSTEITPYKFHVSEDIYTSIILQSDPDRNWKSVLHPTVETKMLSPLDMQSWAMQRFKYAGGTLDILVNDNPLFKRGMTFRQKLMYGMTFWSYLSPFWTVIFIAAPIISLFTSFTPVESYSRDFFLHLLPFLIMHELASMAGTWGIDNSKGKRLNLAFFWLNLSALWAVLRGREIKFCVTPKKRKEDLFLSLVYPQLAVIGLTVAAVAYAAFGLVAAGNNQALGTFVVNTFWGLSNAWAMAVLVSAALWVPDKKKAAQIDVKNRLLTAEAA